MNEVQRALAKIIIPLNIQHIRNYVPELHYKIPELKKQLQEILEEESVSK